jgi:ribosomal protein L12E/L44/L45/RPP1/RPP2
VAFEELRARLIAAGVAGHVAADLTSRHDCQRIEQVLAVAAAQPPRNAAGWIVRALRDDWDLSDRLAEIDHAETQARQAQAHRAQAQRVERERAERAHADDADRQRAEGWSQAVSAALDDDQLTAAVELVTTPVASVGRRSVPVAHSQLVTWAALVASRLSDRCLAAALSGALERGLDLAGEVAAGPPLPDPPPVEQAPPVELRRRLEALLKVESSHEPVSKGA